MPTFRNISDQVFVDGNITVLPNQQWTVMDPSRVDQLTNQYGWQFACLDGEASVKQPAKSLSKMNKDELLALAQELELSANPEMSNKTLQDMITQARQKEG